MNLFHSTARLRPVRRVLALVSVVVVAAVLVTNTVGSSATASAAVPTDSFKVFPLSAKEAPLSKADTKITGTESVTLETVNANGTLRVSLGVPANLRTFAPIRVGNTALQFHVESDYPGTVPAGSRIVASVRSRCV